MTEQAAWVEDVRLDTVYERDEGRCQICQQSVALDLPSQHALSATLHHVHALVVGGKHEYSNVQLAHRSCNSGLRERGPLFIARTFGDRSSAQS